MNQTAFSSYDEMFDGQGAVRAAYSGYCGWLDGQDPSVDLGPAEPGLDHFLPSSTRASVS
jgi:hypothetical protein